MACFLSNFTAFSASRRRLCSCQCSSRGWGAGCCVVSGGYKENKRGKAPLPRKQQPPPNKTRPSHQPLDLCIPRLCNVQRARKLARVPRCERAQPQHLRHRRRIVLPRLLQHCVARAERGAVKRFLRAGVKNDE